MSFLLPISEFAASDACMLAPDALTPECVRLLGLSESEEPVFILWGGSGQAVDRLLHAVEDEAVNRSLGHLVCHSPHPPYRRTAIWVEGVGILRSAGTRLPERCRLIDLSSLFVRLSDREVASLEALRSKADAADRRCRELGSAAAALSRATLSLTEPIHAVESLRKKAERIALAQPSGSGRCLTLPITTLTAEGKSMRALPFGASTQIIGLSELCGTAARFLQMLEDALSARGADRILLTDRLSGETEGIWLPSGALCYLTDPPELRQKLMTLSRYLLPRTQVLRKRWRTLGDCRKMIGGEIAHLFAERAEITAQIDKIEESALQKSRLGEFRKRLLIELYCK